MKIERISENRIRVFISTEDLQERAIDLDAFQYNTPETQALFWDLMEQAEVELGFDVQDSQVMVEAVNDAERGFVITITRMDEDGEFESFQKFIKNRYKKKDLHVKKKTVSVHSTMVIYNFDSLEDMTAACHEVHPIFTGLSTAYRLDNQYYMLITGLEDSVTNKNRFDAILAEYADKVNNTTFFEGYLNEYGVRMIDMQAIPILASF